MKAPAYTALSALVAAAILYSCDKKNAPNTLAPDPENFVTEYDGKTTGLYTLRNSEGMEVSITNFGGRIVSILVPDRDGNLKDVVLGFDNINDYLPENNQTDFGAAIGRYANRIFHGQLPIGGDTIQLPVNNFGHTLHGGPSGWQYKVYDVMEANDSTLTLRMLSPDGDNGFPGNVIADVTYRLTDDNALDISYSAVTDRPTVINMTNHSYFNLNGDPSQPVTDNILWINGSTYTPVDSTYMTSGEILPVSGTPMDFTKAHLIGDSINNTAFEQIKNGNGYDHNWVLDTKGDITVPAVTLSSPSTGIILEVYTTEPGIQVYSGNFLDGTMTGKGGTVIPQRAGICLETQHYPDSPNKPEWPSTRLDKGDTYSTRTIYRFGVAE